MEKQAEAGNTEAMNEPGKYYKKNNPKKSFEWSLQSAEAGSPDGMYLLGVCYSSGIGTQIDVDKGNSLIQEAIERGSILAKAIQEFENSSNP